MSYMVPMKNKLWFVIAILGLAFVTFLSFGGVDTFTQMLTLRTVNASDIVISSIEVKANKISINGGTGSSGIAYVSHKYNVIDDNVYVRFKYALVSERNRKGKFEVMLTDDFKNIKNVYVQGSIKDDLKLIWSK